MNRASVAKSSSIDSLSPELQQRLADALDSYLSGLEQGAPPDVEDVVGQFPDLADPLREYLSSLDFLHEASAELRPSGQRHAVDAESPQRQLGDYTIVRELGRGGMGVVYEANQISLNRRVALKVLPFAAVLDRRQIARFYNEAQAAAHLNHPHIVPVFSVGCERGVHYYAMQYIEGQPLDVAIGQLRRMAGGPPERVSRSAPTKTCTQADTAIQGSRTWRALASSVSLRTSDYFRTVAKLGIEAAEALDYAHQCGIVHRDVKPSNLLLDDQGKLWITDFGLARFHTNGSLTHTGDMMGTIRYMSPEQVAGQPGLVDQRTDVYSLGITLYELATLNEAFAGSDRQAFLRWISEEEPRPPRQIDPAIPVDLETIVLKAIARSPQDRYATAKELADDLRHFLGGEPVLARRAGLADRAEKWARRHKTLVAAAAAMLVVVLIGSVVSTLLIAQEQARTKSALRQIAEEQANTKAALSKAEANYRQARSIVDRFTRRHEIELAALPGAERLRRELLADALQYYQQFVEQSVPEGNLRFDLATTRFRIAQITEQLGDRPRALAAYREAEQLLERRANDPAASAEHRDELALCRNNIGLLLGQAGKTAEAEAAFRQAIALLSKVIAAEPEPGQRARYQSDLALCHGNRALVLTRAGRISEAEGCYRAAISIQRQLVSAYPQERRYAAALAISNNDLSYVLAKTDLAAATHCCREAIVLQEKLVAAEPSTVVWQFDLALSHNNLGYVENHAGRTEAATASYRRAIDIQRELVRRAPAVPQYRRDLAVSYNNLGRLCSQIQRLEQAQQMFREARTILEELVHDDPAELNYRSDLGGTLNNLGAALEQAGRADEALKAYAESIEHQRFALERAPQIARVREFLIQQYDNYSRLLRAQKRSAEAEVAIAAGKRLRTTNGESTESHRTELSPFRPEMTP